MKSVIFIATLAVVGSFFSALLGLIFVPNSFFSRFKYSHPSESGRSPGYSRLPAYSGLSERGGIAKDSRQEKYRLPEIELSREERLFCDVLVKAVGDSGVVFSKVPVANVLAPSEGFGRSRSGSAPREIPGRHFDFVVCAADGSATKLAIEFDEDSPASVGQAKKAELLDNMCQSAGLPLLRIKPARGYAIGNVRERLAAALADSGAARANFDSGALLR